MTKRWSSTRSDLTKTKRQASKERRRALVDYRDEVTAHQVKQIDALVAGEFEASEWEIIESE